METTANETSVAVKPDVKSVASPGEPIKSGDDTSADVTVEKPIVSSGIKGQVKWFNVKRGYGFVMRHDTGEDLFIHQTAIKAKNPASSRRSVGEKEQIEFDVVQGAKGLEAHNVTGPDGAAVQGSPYAQPHAQQHHGNQYRGRRRRMPPGGGGGGGHFSHRPGTAPGMGMMGGAAHRMRSYSEGSEQAAAQYGYRVPRGGRGGRGYSNRFRAVGGGGPNAAQFGGRAPRPFMIQYRGGGPPTPPPHAHAHHHGPPHQQHPPPQVYNPDAYMMGYSGARGMMPPPHHAMHGQPPPIPQMMDPAGMNARRPHHHNQQHHHHHQMAMQNDFFSYPPPPQHQQMYGAHGGGGGAAGRPVMMPMGGPVGGRIGNRGGARYYTRHPRSRGDSATGPESDGELAGRGGTGGRPYRNQGYRRNRRSSRKNSEKQEPDSTMQENEQMAVKA